MSSRNRKQDSVLLDAKCDYVECAIIPLGLIYDKVTGPYWILMGKELKYLDFFNHVCELHVALSQWSEDPTPLTDKNTPPLFGLKVNTNVFPSKISVLPSRQ